MSDKFLRRCFLSIKDLHKNGFFKDQIIRATVLDIKDRPAAWMEYLSIEEHNAIVSELERKLKVARKALKEIHKATALKDFYELGEEIVHKSLEEIEGTK